MDVRGSLVLLQEGHAAELHLGELVVVELHSRFHHCWRGTSKHALGLDKALHLCCTLGAALCEASKNPIAVWFDRCKIGLLLCQQVLQVGLLYLVIINLCVGITNGLLQVRLLGTEIVQQRVCLSVLLLELSLGCTL